MRAALLHNARAAHVRQLPPGEGTHVSRGTPLSRILQLCRAARILGILTLVYRAQRRNRTVHSAVPLTRCSSTRNVCISGNTRGALTANVIEELGPPCRRSHAGQRRSASPSSAARWRPSGRCAGCPGCGGSPCPPQCPASTGRWHSAHRKADWNHALHPGLSPGLTSAIARGMQAGCALQVRQKKVAIITWTTSVVSL